MYVKFTGRVVSAVGPNVAHRHDTARFTAGHVYELEEVEASPIAYTLRDDTNWKVSYSKEQLDRLIQGGMFTVVSDKPSKADEILVLAHEWLSGDRANGEMDKLCKLIIDEDEKPRVYRATLFYSNGLAPMRHHTAEDDTPERAMTRCARGLFSDAIIGEFGLPTWQPSSGTVFLNGVPCGCVWEVK